MTVIMRIGNAHIFIIMPMLKIMLFVPQNRVFAIEPVTAVFGISGATLALTAAVSKTIFCRFEECCTDRWIRTEATGLRSQLQQKVHGQHIAISSVAKLLNAHLRKQPKRALVLSFHGWTGTGKTHVSKLIADWLYERGMRSHYVHVLSAMKDFPRHELLKDYQDHIRNWVRGNVSACPRQMFVFDEVDKMPEGLLDALTPYVDFYDTVDGVDYRKCVFIFLGNVGGDAIVQRTFGHYLSGLPREALVLKDMEEKVLKGSFKANGVRKNSDLIREDLIAAYVPFLPLEREHMRMCIRDDMKYKNVTINDGLVEAVLKQLTFWPSDSKQVFALTGCRGVSQKVDLVTELY